MILVFFITALRISTLIYILYNMAFENIAIISFAILLSFQSIRSEAYTVINASKKLGQSHYSSKTSPQIIFERSSVENKSLSYAICEDIIDKSAKECSVLLETYSSNNVIYKDACKFILKPAENATNVLSNQFKIARLANNKIIFGWLEKYSNSSTHGAFFKTRIIHFPGCSSKETTLDLNGFSVGEDSSKDIVLLAYDDSTYDVVYCDASNKQNEWFKTTFDSEGNCIMHPKTWFKIEDSQQLPKIYPIKYRSSAGGHIIIPTFGFRYKALLIQNDGVTKQLASRELSNQAVWSFGSAGNNLIGLCSVNGITYDYLCTQFDLEGNVVMPELRISYGYDATFSSLFNLEKGGFLLVTKEVTNTNLLYHVTKIDNLSIMYRTLEIPEFKCDHSRHAIASNIFIADNGDYCLTLVCRQYNYIITVHCFSDKDLSVLF